MMQLSLLVAHLRHVQRVEYLMGKQQLKEPQQLLRCSVSVALEVLSQSQIKRTKRLRAELHDNKLGMRGDRAKQNR